MAMATARSATALRPRCECRLVMGDFPPNGDAKVKLTLQASEGLCVGDMVRAAPYTRDAGCSPEEVFVRAIRIRVRPREPERCQPFYAPPLLSSPQPSPSGSPQP